MLDLCSLNPDALIDAAVVAHEAGYGTEETGEGTGVAGRHVEQGAEADAPVPISTAGGIDLDGVAMEQVAAVTAASDYLTEEQQRQMNTGPAGDASNPLVYRPQSTIMSEYVRRHQLTPRLFPLLFPYGIGGPAALKGEFKAWVQHCLLNDGRFAADNTFCSHVMT